MFVITHFTIIFTLFAFAQGNNSSLKNIATYSRNLDNLNVSPLLSNLASPFNIDCLHCYSRMACLANGGIPYRTCGYLQYCCAIYRTCGTIVQANNTFFTNPSYPLVSNGVERCQIIIQRMNANINQLRLNFVEFSLDQPSASGECQNDFFSVSGAVNAIPKICGENTDQHLYVDVGSNPITLLVHATTDLSIGRRWVIQIQQISSDSPWKAPKGCLQYYTSVSGTINSFNFGLTSNQNSPTGTREMINLNYGVCIRAELDYCRVQWASTSSSGFSISGDTSSSLKEELSGVSCTTDYVIIPDPIENGEKLNVDRFCGTDFKTKISSLQPFVLFVVTDASEAATDNGNKGFSLSYKQLICNKF